MTTTTRAIVHTYGYSAELTTDSPLSSHGQPVLLVEGRTYGPDDLIDEGEGSRPAWEIVQQSLRSGNVAPHADDTQPVAARDIFASDFLGTDPAEQSNARALSAARDLAARFVAAYV